MRRGAFLVASALLALPARAQVTVNPGALDALPKAQAPAPARHPPPARTTHPTPAPANNPAGKRPPATAQGQKPAKPPTIPVTPPAILALPPPIQVPVAHPPPPPVVPVANDAPGAAAPIAGGLRVTFGADRADLNPATEAALRQFARAVKDNEALSVNVYAYASGSAEDPSSPRRLSLSRALAARAVLINEGIASPRIYPRALGAAGGDTDPDRVDVLAGQPSAPPTAAPSAAPKTTP